MENSLNYQLVHIKLNLHKKLKNMFNLCLILILVASVVRLSNYLIRFNCIQSGKMDGGINLQYYNIYEEQQFNCRCSFVTINSMINISTGTNSNNSTTNLNE